MHDIYHGPFAPNKMPAASTTSTGPGKKNMRAIEIALPREEPSDDDVEIRLVGKFPMPLQSTGHG